MDGQEKRPYFSSFSSSFLFLFSFASNDRSSRRRRRIHLDLRAIEWHSIQPSRTGLDEWTSTLSNRNTLCGSHSCGKFSRTNNSSNNNNNNNTNNRNNHGVHIVCETDEEQERETKISKQQAVDLQLEFFSIVFFFFFFFIFFFFIFFFFFFFFFSCFGSCLFYGFSCVFLRWSRGSPVEI